MKKLVIILAVIIAVLLGVVLFYNPAKSPTISTPQPAVSSDGKATVSFPFPDTLITSPVTITGSVTGGEWFFEASFPAKVLDGDGKVIGQVPAQAGGEPGSWMSTGTVPFSATITFTAPKYATGTILLEKDNPSGLPQNVGELRIPIKFK